MNITYPFAKRLIKTLFGNKLSNKCLVRVNFVKTVIAFCHFSFNYMTNEAMLMSCDNQGLNRNREMSIIQLKFPTVLSPWLQ